MFVGHERFEVKLRSILFYDKEPPDMGSKIRKVCKSDSRIVRAALSRRFRLQIFFDMHGEKSSAPTFAQGEKRAVINLSDDPQHLIDILSARHPQQFIHLLRKMWVEYSCSEYREMDDQDFQEEILVFQDSMQFFNELDSYLKRQTSDLE